MINLKLHQCYQPFIFIYQTLYYDKNKKEYFKGRYQAANSEKKGFIVRPEFNYDWLNRSIAEINIELTDKGATIINYHTFESLEKTDGRKFIETTGIFFEGTFLIDNPDAARIEKITFIPGYPNRSSLGIGCNVNYSFDRTFSIKLIGLPRNNMDLANAYNFYDDGTHWSVHKKYYEAKRSFVTSTVFYYIITKFDIGWEENFRPNGIKGVTDFGDGDEIDVWKYSIVFDSLEDLIKAIEDTRVISNEEISKTEQLIKFYTDIVNKELSYAKTIKKTLMTQLNNLLKVELKPIFVPSEEINTSEAKILLSKIKGTIFNSEAMSKGIGLYSTSSCLGLELDKENEYMSKIQIAIIAQV